MTDKLDVPHNVTILPLPAKCPELNPQENIWQFMRDNWLSNRVFNQLRRHRRPLLRSLDKPHRPAMAHHVHRHA
jgi:hypothetical protein